MARRFLGRVIFLRHGQTKYTGVFPDLTYEGTVTIKKSGDLIKPFLDGSSNVVIISSPMVTVVVLFPVLARS